MIQLIARRTLTAFVSILGIALVIFVVTQLLPGDAARVRAGQYATEEQIAAIRQQFGLDQPIHVQLFAYLAGIFRFDLGDSTRTGQPVMLELMQRLPATLELSALALIFALLIGAIGGLASSAWRGKFGDFMARGFTILASSTASFWIGLLAILLLCNVWHVFPNPVGRLPRGFSPPPAVTGSYVLDSLVTGDIGLALASLWMLTLPALLLGIIASPSIIKALRAATNRALDSDFARTSRSFGYSPRSILFHDGVRNAMLPLLTTVGIVAGFLLGGNIIIEQLFSWPGIGQYAYLALQQHDLNALRGFALLVGTIYVLLNMLIDILYAAADPRIEYGKAA
ncbi:ABC transporter permease [Microbacterium trichothecenolyticum]|uniref:ABC transporter permease n=1 Tax=Microbacterium ureisolvens TaxID=2781186 RepID=A0ABS7I1U4_9MICO|nr:MULTISPECIES: ABC transporter permease [Microbacterium]MBW9110458.1 ABC transporter permease [Microbacterium ureisolvens]MBW9120563.1 ABC transporter permease [Microbacterium trichothecenolyticum]